MYQLTTLLRENAEAQCIKRMFDNAFIPFDPANIDYQAYLEWLSQGNTPLPADSQEEIK